jgi:hypothetical protein
MTLHPGTALGLQAQQLRGRLSHPGRLGKNQPDAGGDWFPAQQPAVAQGLPGVEPVLEITGFQRAGDGRRPHGARIGDRAGSSEPLPISLCRGWRWAARPPAPPGPEPFDTSNQSDRYRELERLYRRAPGPAYAIATEAQEVEARRSTHRGWPPAGTSPTSRVSMTGLGRGDLNRG